MMKLMSRALRFHPWLRVGLAVILLIAGLAPVGAPILSDNSWRQAGLQPATSAASAQPFAYRATAAAEVTRVQRSDDGGATWHDMAAIPAPVAGLQTVAGNEQVVFARGADAIWLSDDGGASWAQATPLPSRPLSLLVGDKTRGLLMVGTESAGLWVSRDLGATWQAVEDAALAEGGAAPLAITALAVEGEHTDVLYAATAIWLGTSHARLTPIGVYASVDGGRRWLALERLALNDAPVSELKPVAGRPLAVSAASGASSRVAAMKLSPELLALLAGEDAGLRASAARAIGLIGDAAALPALLARLNDSDALAGDAAATAIGQLGDRSAIPVLLETLAATAPTVSGRAAAALGMLKAPEAVPALANLLMAGDPGVARRAAEALAAIGTTDALSALVAPLADASMTSARHAALSGLEQAGPQAIPTLSAALDDERAAVRANAAEMLGWLRAGSATPALIQALTDDDPVVRSQAAWALGEVATPAAREALAKALQAEQDAAARQATASALANANRLAGEAQAAAGSFWAAVAAVPASRWTFLVLAALTVGLLFWIGPRRTHLPHG